MKPLIPAVEQLQGWILPEEYNSLLEYAESYQKVMPGREDSDVYCFNIKKGVEGFCCQTSYFVGIDWVNEDIAIQVRPKLENDSSSIDYLRMLTEALQESETAEYLDGLLTVDFDAKPIPLSEKEDLLSPFLVALFLMVLKKAVRKGLRQSYYLVSSNLRSKVKGKILVGQNIRKNLSQGNIVDNTCQYQEYGVDSEENKILKKALEVSSRLLSTYRGGLDVKNLKRMIAAINPYFRMVSDDYNLDKVSAYKENPIFKDYYVALKYGILILKRRAYGFDRNSDAVDSTPPYWIDMSKLFELYVFHKIRNHYSSHELKYHPHFWGRELDYLLNPEDAAPMVIDAKYKPQYHSGKYDIDDIRQISAYARMKGVYDTLKLPYDKLIDCLIIYANQECEDEFPDRFDKVELDKISAYIRFYRIGISLPTRTSI